MILAIEHLRNFPDTPAYAHLLALEHVKFQYPISSLIFIDLAQRATGAAWPAVISALNWLSWAFVWTIGIVAWCLFMGAHRGAAAPPAERAADRIALLWPCLAITILFYPLGRSFWLGQIQTSMTLLSAAALLMWQHDRKRVAGFCIGLCCAFKPQLAVVFVWAALRREWSMLAAGAATFGLLAVAAGALYGFGHYFEYANFLSFLSHHGEAFFPNQSVNGLMNRLFFTGDNLQYSGEIYPEFHPAVYVSTVVAAALLLIAALLFRRGEKAGPLDLALIMLASTMASPIAWEHHYGILLPIFALLAPIYLAKQPMGRYSVAVLLIAFFFASQRMDVTNRFAETHLNVVQSYLLFAAALVLVLIYHALRQGYAGGIGEMTRAPSDARPPPPEGALRDARPLCVDLDGTLIRTDILLESLLAACKGWRTLAQLPVLLIRGKAGLKAGLAEACPVDCALLPYNRELLSFLEEQKARGRKLVLATASNGAVASRINRHLNNLFDEVIGSDGERNLRGAEKARVLTDRFGERGFVYVGNDRTDLEVWREAGGAVLAGAPAWVARRAARIARIDDVVSDRPSALRTTFKEIRPQQWLKNLLVFVPILTAGDFTDTGAWWGGFVAFLAFCAAASSVYIVNDLLDLEADRKHPRKRARPLASGELPLAAGAALAVSLVALGSVLAATAGVLPYVLAYAAMSTAYSAKLKEKPLVDVFLLAGLYSIRLAAGGVATGNEVSFWLLAFSCFLFLSLAIMKRVTELNDLRQRGETDVARRGYSPSDMLILLAFGTSATLVSSVVLALYVHSADVIAAHSNAEVLWAIVPLMLFWQCRLWLATSRGKMMDDPIVYTAKDWVSALVAVGLAATVVLSHAPL